MDSHLSNGSSCMEPFGIDQDMAELSLLLPRSQAVELIEAAELQHLTVAQFLRQLVGRALAEVGAQTVVPLKP